MFFQKTYKPIPLAYNLVVAMLWRHPENVELEKVKAVHYCAAVSTLWSLKFINFIFGDFFFFPKKKFSLLNNISIFLVNRGQNHGGTRARKLTWTERTSRCWWQNGGIYTMMNPLISMLIKTLVLQKRKHFQSQRSLLPCPSLPFHTFQLHPLLEKSLKSVWSWCAFLAIILFFFFLFLWL